MKRRDFIKNCSLLCVGGMGFSAVLASCGSVHYAAHSFETNKIKLRKNEFIDAKQKERKFVIIKPEQLQFPVCLYKNNTEYVALYMQCTHQGCELKPNNVSLVCPCHGSEFSVNGKVMSPPADKNLKQFKVISDNENIYIEL